MKFINYSKCRICGKTTRMDNMVDDVCKYCKADFIPTKEINNANDTTTDHVADKPSSANRYRRV